MRRLLIGLLGLFLVAAGSAAQDRPADLRLAGAGAAADGQAMALDCVLSFAIVPSNTFVGHCKVTLGPDQLTLGVGPPAVSRPVTVVLNGALTVRGLAEAGTGPFAPLVPQSAAGFPVDLRVDPLGRAWLIRAELPGGGSRIVAAGSLATGTVGLHMQ
jgi:hypothetical protein